MKIDTPILVLGFNRPNLLEKSLEFLLSVSKGPIFVSLDGKKEFEPTYQYEIESQLKLLESFDYIKTLKWRVNDSNLGCFRGVVEGINWFFSQNSKGIILEDDLVINQSTLKYFEDALLKYENEPSVAAINGYRLNRQSIDATNLPRMSKYASSWGWATWQNRWNGFIFDTKSISNLEFMFEIYKKTNLHEAMHWLAIKKKLESNQIDSWAYRWLISNLLLGRYSIIPPFNLVKNVGFGEAATHTKFLRHIEPISESIIHLPEFSDLKYDIVYDSVLRSEVYSIRSWSSLLLAKLKIKF